MTIDHRLSAAAFALHGKYPWLDKIAVFCARHLIFILLISAILAAGCSDAPVCSVHPFHLVFEEESWIGIGIVLFVAGLAWGLSTLLETLIRRPRPYLTFFKKPLATFWTPTPSFPSSHTAIASALALMIFHLMNGPLALLAFFEAVVATMLIGASRVYAGVHYPSDILAGALLGLFLGWAGPFAILWLGLTWAGAL